MKKVCVITCYNDPDYVRARAIRSALEKMNGVELLVVKNSKKGVLRYLEVLMLLIKTRITQRPDHYILTFRGYEMLPFVWLICLGKPLIFDEFINLIEWVAYEHKKIKPHSLPYKVLWSYYRVMLHMPKVILTDTEAHAEYSAELMRMPRAKFVAIPVATDESVFHASADPNKHVDTPLEIFYYGNMLPLHGLLYVIDAAVQLKDLPFHFTVVGGKDAAKNATTKAIQSGANITYKKWIPFEQLPGYVHNSDVCLGGPYGGTVQAEMVITGKTYQFMASGKTVVVGKIKSTTPFVDKENCLLVEQASSESLATAFRWALENREKLNEIGKNAAEIYQKELSVAVVAERLQKLL